MIVGESKRGSHVHGEREGRRREIVCHSADGVGAGQSQLHPWDSVDGSESRKALAR